MEQLYLRSSDIEKQRKYLQKFKQLMDDTKKKHRCGQKNMKKFPPQPSVNHRIIE